MGKRKQEAQKESQEQEAVVREQRRIRGLKARVGREYCISIEG